MEVKSVAIKDLDTTSSLGRWTTIQDKDPSTHLFSYTLSISIHYRESSQNIMD